eukprot:81836_1
MAQTVDITKPIAKWFKFRYQTIHYEHCYNWNIVLDVYKLGDHFDSELSVEDFNKRWEYVIQKIGNKVVELKINELVAERTNKQDVLTLYVNRIDIDWDSSI